MRTQELEQKVRELRQMQAIVEEAQAEVEALKDAIKAAMGPREELRAGEYKVTWKAVTISRLDTAKLKKALAHVAAAFTTQSTTRRFIVA